MMRRVPNSKKCAPYEISEIRKGFIVGEINLEAWLRLNDDTDLVLGSADDYGAEHQGAFGKVQLCATQSV